MMKNQILKNDEMTSLRMEQWETLGEIRDWLTEQYNNPSRPEFYRKEYVLQWREAVEQAMVTTAIHDIPPITQFIPVMPAL
ncbi:hypothetical protein GCM10007377_15660 [Galliscardovia ingluviei]|uniref:Uncharacterized protein n=1 Tax=Galliscardovia ingluviei TaxID=1769422 RepID=A0A8J3AMB8_9BIFI|nr:hypothetical protein [Galliscardovia ingluviei]GGI15390.1 hypothetical protein GCM10007377_15660 [Galliscardovia ingluviei]